MKMGFISGKKLLFRTKKENHRDTETRRKTRRGRKLKEYEEFLSPGFLCVSVFRFYNFLDNQKITPRRFFTRALYLVNYILSEARQLGQRLG